MDTDTLPTRNTDWGFCGTIGHHADAKVAWPLAKNAIATATGCPDTAVRDFLDSRHGRHFADDVANGLVDGLAIAPAIDATVKRWMGWTSGETVSCHILRGLITKAFCFDLIEGLPVPIQDGILSGLRLPALDGNIDIGRADFHGEDAAIIGLVRHDLRARAAKRLVTQSTARHMLAHGNPKRIERLRRRMVMALILGKGRQLPGGRQGLVGHLGRTLALHPAHEAGLVFPEVVRPGQDATVLHPNDLLMDKGACLFPARLQHRLTAGRMPTVPGRALG